LAELNYSNLRILIADDFSNFRATVKGMLAKLNVHNVDVASTGDEVIEICKKKRFDVILCDYNLGPGRNGQHVLEELRYRALISKRSIFIMVSAETAKDVVMAAYECEPDDYLMKPITTMMLQQRMGRLLLQRQALAAVYKAMDNKDNSRAMALLIDLSLAEGRHSVIAQKLLGEMFIAAGELGKAEKLYTKALQTRQLDWARLGLAKVKQLQGELEVAGGWLEQIVSDNPLFLPAYDVLASNWEKQGQDRQVQDTIQRSVDISPKSILRHKRLAAVAERNGDAALALKALRTTVRLGELSCHASPEDCFSFARVASSCIEQNIEATDGLAVEAVDIMRAARSRFSLSREQELRADLIEGRALALGGHQDEAEALVKGVEESMRRASNVPIELQVDRVTALQALGHKEEADELLQELLQVYAYDQDALEQLDGLLPEPVSELNRAMIASVNREGIELYNNAQFDQAIAHFMTVSQMFPKHVGVQLNIVQTLVGKLKAGKRDNDTIEQTEAALATIGALIDRGHSQYARFQRLQGMAMANLGK
jgi:CheY-like chemotaxis protein